MDNTIDEKEFGEFGEIAVKNCFICGKTIRKSNCYEFERRNPNSPNVLNQKHSICLKCILKGLYGICKSKEEIDKYLDLYIKIAIVDNIDAQLNK
jgi:hypothetical protein